jgi:hypothetical protein
MCSPIGVDRLEGDAWTTLPLSTDRPVCECSHSCDGEPVIETIPLSPGDAYDVVWDGRSADLADEWLACGAAYLCTSSACDAHNPQARLRPAPAGTYRITLGVHEAACPGDGSESTCFGSWSVPGVHGLCPASTQVSVDFELPESGEFVVPLSLESPKRARTCSSP